MERCLTCHSEIGRSLGNCVVCGKPACTGCGANQFSRKKKRMVAVHHDCRGDFPAWDGREPPADEERQEDEKEPKKAEN
jgi:hypothetical protein